MSGVYFSDSSCVGDTLLLLLLLCGDDTVDTALPCESMLRIEPMAVGDARVRHVAPQKFKSSLLPAGRNSRSRSQRLASRSLSKCS